MNKVNKEFFATEEIFCFAFYQRSLGSQSLAIQGSGAHFSRFKMMQAFRI